MHGPGVRFRLADGSEVRVAPGGIVGRTSSASLRLMDPRVSEAHAMVSLRGRELRLLGLRGLLFVDGEPEDEVALRPGQVISLAAGVELVVLGVDVPREVLTVLIGEDQWELCAAAYSLILSPAPELVPRWVQDAPAAIWSTDDGWVIRLGAAGAVPVRSGRSYEIDGVTLRAVAAPPSDGLPTTVRPSGHLRLVCRTTTVHLHRRQRIPFVVDGRAGRMLSELALMGAPVEWQVVAREIWSDEADAFKLRKNFDAVLGRLRSRLREGGVREDLVRTDGHGNVEIFLYAGDEVVDES